jgi:hypothetical protein
MKLVFKLNIKTVQIRNEWLMQGIGVSCKCKRYLYMHSRNSSDPHTKASYVKCCKILNKVIK